MAGKLVHTVVSGLKRALGVGWDARAEARRKIQQMVELRGDPHPALSDAIGRNDLAAIGSLLGGGIGPNETDRQGESPLMFAAYRGRAEVVRYLLRAGADVNHQCHAGNTALHLAVDAAVDHETHAPEEAKNDSLDTIRVLLEAGADRARRNARGQTPVDWAHGFEPVLRLFGK